VNIITKIVVARVAFGIVLEFYLFCSRLRGLQVGGGRWAAVDGWWVRVVLFDGSGKHRNDFSK